MPTPRQSSYADAGITTEAARWIGRLDHATAQDRGEFVAWLRASPQHAKEFLLLSAQERELDHLDLRGFDVDALLAQIDENVIPLHELEREAQPPLVPNSALSPRSSRRRRGIWRSAAGIAAAMLLAVGAWWMIEGPGSWQRYATDIGEQLAFELEDGSTIEMSPRSNIWVRMSPAFREVRINSGEALFKVTPDRARPFVVDGDSTVVRVLGTWFAVNRRSNSVTVSVLKGRVAVDELIVVAGEGVKIMSTGTVVERSVTPESSDIGRPHRTLVFSGDTLAEIAEDFNRYNRSPRILVEGDAARARQFSGVFDAHDPDSLIHSLARDRYLEVVQRDGEIVIRQKLR